MPPALVQRIGPVEIDAVNNGGGYWTGSGAITLGSGTGSGNSLLVFAIPGPGWYTQNLTFSDTAGNAWGNVGNLGGVQFGFVAYAMNTQAIAAGGQFRISWNSQGPPGYGGTPAAAITLVFEEWSGVTNFQFLSSFQAPSVGGSPAGYVPPNTHVNFGNISTTAANSLIYEVLTAGGTPGTPPYAAAQPPFAGAAYTYGSGMQNPIGSAGTGYYPGYYATSYCYRQATTVGSYLVDATYNDGTNGSDGHGTYWGGPFYATPLLLWGALPPVTAPNPVATAYAGIQISVAGDPNHTTMYQQLQRSPHSAGSWTTIATISGAALNATTNTITDAPVPAATTYDYRVIATNNIGSSTSGISTVTSASALIAPLIATAQYPTAANPIQISLSWTALPSYSGGYTVQRGTSPGSLANIGVGGGSSGTSYVDTTVLPGVLYYYRIAATTGTTYYSPVVGVYSPGPAAPTAPKVSGDPYFGCLDIFWDSVPSLLPATYAVQKSPTGAGAWATLATGIVGNFYQDTSTVIPAVPAAWDYRIVATDIPPGLNALPYGGYATAGATATWNPSGYSLAPSPPAVVQPPGSGTATVYWGAPPGPAGPYILQRSSDNCQTWATLYSGPALSYGDNTIIQYTRYWYRVVNNATAYVPTGLSTSIFIDTVQPINAGYRVIVDGVDQSARMASPTPKIDRQANDRGAEASFTLHYEPGPSSLSTLPVVAIWFGRELRFYGWAVNMVRRSITPTVEEVDFKCRDATFALEGTYVTESFEQATLAQIIAQLVCMYVPGLTVTQVVTQLFAPPVLASVVFSHEQLSSAIRRLLATGAAQVASPVFTITPNLDLVLSYTQATPVPNAAVLLSDVNPMTGGYPR